MWIKFQRQLRDNTTQESPVQSRLGPWGIWSPTGRSVLGRYVDGSSNAGAEEGSSYCRDLELFQFKQPEARWSLLKSLRMWWLHYHPCWSSTLGRGAPSTESTEDSSIGWVLPEQESVLLAVPMDEVLSKSSRLEEVHKSRCVPHRIMFPDASSSRVQCLVSVGYILVFKSVKRSQFSSSQVYGLSISTSHFLETALTAGSASFTALLSMWCVQPRICLSKNCPRFRGSVTSDK